MKSTLRRLGLVAGMVLPLTLGAAASGLAQPRPNERMGPPPGAEHWRGPPERHMAGLEHLGVLLQLRPDQQPALQNLLSTLRAQPRGMRAGMGPGAGSAGLTTPQRLDRMMAGLDAARSHLAQVADATKRFYAQLTPSQQRAFDALTAMMFSHGAMMGGHMMMMHEHMMGGRMMGGEMRGGAMGTDGRPPG